MKLKYPALLAVALFGSPVFANDIVITEIMQNPNAVSDSKGEWFEILNTGTSDINLNGWVVSEDDGNNESFTIQGDLIIKSGHYGVFAINSDTSVNGGVTAIYDYNGMTLSNSKDEIVIYDGQGTEIDRVVWDNGATFPDPTGAAMVLNDVNADNNVGTNWSTATDTYGDGDKGTPNAGPDGLPSDSGSEEPQEPEPEAPCFNCPELAKIENLPPYVDSEYYADAIAEVNAGSSAAMIKAAITDIISTGHKDLSYSEVWTALTYTDEDPANSDNVILWYRGITKPKNKNGSGSQSSDQENWNREHSWPQSHGFKDLGESAEAYTDIHHLRATDISVNASRGNLDFDNSDNALTESPNNKIDSDSFEPRDEVKGDVARMMFYMDTRYEGSGSDVTPDLKLVDRLTSTGVPELGRLCRLIEWHGADPVDAAEELRNETIYQYQGNRNPFIDHPEWVDTLYQTEACSGTGGGTDPEPEPEPEPEPPVGNGGSVFINEIHYDNSGRDTGEAIEVAGPAGTDLAGFSLVLYNGSNGKKYKTVDLEGAIADQQSGFGTLSFPISGIQNGSPDGMALVDAEDNVLQFLSYEGVLTASNGPAQGMESVDIGVSEASNALVGSSLQLTGTGNKYSDFVWAGSRTDNFGAINTGQTFVAPTPFINEIHYDNSGADTGEAIEIAGAAGIDLAGLSLVLYNGSNGKKYKTVELEGVIADQQNGFGTLSFAISGIQNGSPDGMALVDAQGTVIQFLSYEGELTAVDGAAEGKTSTDIGVSEPSNTAVGSSLQLTGTGSLYSDFTWAGSSSANFGDINNGQSFGAGTGGGEGEEVVLGVCADPATLIHEVQGAGFNSPLEGETVVVEAVVTAAFAGSNGFYIQEEDADVDADSQTSEGMFVAYSGSETQPAVGTVVRVIGSVKENYARTQLEVDTELLDCGTDSVSIATLTLPFANAEMPESLEGMLVVNSDSLVVTDNSLLGRFGEAVLSSGRLFTPTNQFAPGSDEAIALDAQNKLNSIVLDDGVNGSNPENVIYPVGGLSASNSLRLGDTVTALTGVMDYSFGKYRVIPTEYPTIVATNPRLAQPDLNLGNVTVASLNVLNYFTTLDQNGNKCGPNLIGCRGANTAEEFVRQKAKTVAAIVAMNADVVGLMEVENNGFGQDSAIQDLVGAINAEMGAGTYAVVDAGGTLGTDAIMVAMLYKPSVVTPVGAAAVLDSTNAISDEFGTLFDDRANRPTTAQKFALVENAEEFVVAVNHWRSKGSQCDDDSNPIPGDDDKTTGQGSCNLTRVRAAEAVLAFLDQTYPEAPTLIIGDLNAYAKEDPVKALENAGFTNLVNHFGGDKTYSYTYKGLSGYLDHALANNKALVKIVDVTEWHINSDEPVVLDYNVEYKSPERLVNFYAADAYRMSDHDPVLISMQIEPSILTPQTSADVNGDGRIDFSDYFAILGMLGSVTGDSNFDPIADYDADGVISPLDLQAWYQLYLGQ